MEYYCIIGLNDWFVHMIIIFFYSCALCLSQSLSAPVCLSLHYTSQDPLVSTPVLTPSIIHLFSVIIICVTCLHLVSVHLYLYLVLSVCSVRVGQCLFIQCSCDVDGINYLNLYICLDCLLLPASHLMTDC